MTTQVPVDKVEIVVNGKAVASRDAHGQKQVTLDEPVSLDGSAWIAVRAIGPWHRLILNDTLAFAHTSPVYVHLGDQRVVFAEDARFYDEWIGKLIAQIQSKGRFATPAHREEVVALFRRAQEIYRGLEK